MSGVRIALVLGATSDIARRIADRLAREGYELLLAGRDVEALTREGKNLETRHGAAWRVLPFDALELDSHPDFVEAVAEVCDGRLYGVVAAFGELGDPDLARADPRHARELVEVNFVGAVTVLTGLAGILERSGDGFIVGLSSVAGDRGRPSNYTYGSAKGALALWLQGLRGRLRRSGVHVLTVKPGFVDTEMTFGLIGTTLAADPDRVARAVLRAVERGRDVIYVPWFWRPIMTAIRLIPERLFKRLDL